MKRKIYDILKIILICIALEIILFNITSYVSVLRKGKKITYDVGKNYNFLYTHDESEIVISINDINQEVKSLKLNVKDNDFLDTFKYKIAYSDATSERLRWIQNEKTYVNGNKRSEYIDLYLSGNVKEIWVVIDNKAFVEEGNIESITINENIKVQFNLIRFCITLAVFLFLYAIKNVEENYNPKNLVQELILTVVVLSAILICNFLNNSAKLSELDFYSLDFLDAIKAGQVNLQKEVNPKFNDLENPYDVLVRDDVVKRGKDFYWDSAYYNGKFYVYFGIVPMLTLLLPFNFITKLYMSSNIAVLIFSAFCMLLFKEVLLKFLNKYFKEIPFKIVVAFLIILSFGSQIIFLNGIPRFYELAIVSGLFFSLLGILLNLDAIEKKEKISYKKMFFGCLSLSLAVGCRPTYLFVSLIILPYLLKILSINIKEKNTKEIFKEAMAVGIPYMIVGLSLMYYNYIRFDSILEFGAKYQLTINNMRDLASRLYVIPKRTTLQFI